MQVVEPSRVVKINTGSDPCQAELSKTIQGFYWTDEYKHIFDVYKIHFYMGMHPRL